jgi:hypothetical protein
MYQTSFFFVGPGDFVFELQNPDLNPVYQTRTIILTYTSFFYFFIYLS